VKQLKSLARQRNSEIPYARDVAAGLVQTGDKAVLDRVGSNKKTIGIDWVTALAAAS